jgi:serine/threonine protein kinase
VKIQVLFTEDRKQYYAKTQGVSQCRRFFRIFCAKQEIKSIEAVKECDYFIRVYGAFKSEINQLPNGIQEKIKATHGILMKNSSAYVYGIIISRAESGTLAEHVRELTVHDRYRLMLQYANSLSCLHNLGLVHNDINI